jgi:integrase
LKVVDIGLRTKATLEGYVRKHIAPSETRPDIRAIGELTWGELKPKVFDDFYAELRRCRDHCSGRPTVTHRTGRPHKCTTKCKIHVCKPLAAWTIRKIHFLMSAACKSATRWQWIPSNPLQDALKPAAPSPDPNPPTPEDAARIVMKAWEKGFGALIWLAMTTGARRGELLALRWRDVQVRHQVRGPHDCALSECQWKLKINKALSEEGRHVWEKDTKTHQRRHISLDIESATVMTSHRSACDRQATLAGFAITDDALVFSASPDGLTWFKPASISQRYHRWVKQLGIETTIKALRHYSATELISAGVDIRTVAGRLGHSGGGTTTLKVYAAWVAEADQRASTTLIGRMPTRPARPPDCVPSQPTQSSPYRDIADELYAAITRGEIRSGDFLPTIVDLAAKYAVAVGTVHRAVSLLSEWGVVEVSRGKRAVVRPIVTSTDHPVIVRSEWPSETSRVHAEPTDKPANAYEDTDEIEASPEAISPRILALELLEGDLDREQGGAQKSATTAAGGRAVFSTEPSRA